MVGLWLPCWGVTLWPPVCHDLQSRRGVSRSGSYQPDRELVKISTANRE